MPSRFGHSSAGRRIASLFLLLGAGLSGSALAQPAGIDARADQLLRSSLAYVAGLKQFTVETRSTIEAVLTSGQKIQFDSAAAMAVDRPNRFRAERKGDLVDQVFYFDGKALTLFNPSDGVYATYPAPGTIDDGIRFARTTLDIEAPAADLVTADAYRVLMQDVTSGFVVGKSVIEGVRCDHLAFRGVVTDFQIWIEEGARPLPRKFVLTTKDVVNAPQFAVLMTKWDTAPAFRAGTFDFAPPANARRIEFLVAPAGTR